MSFDDIKSELETLQDEMWRLLILERDISLSHDADEKKYLMTEYNRISTKIFGTVRLDRKL